MGAAVRNTGSARWGVRALALLGDGEGGRVARVHVALRCVSATRRRQVLRMRLTRLGDRVGSANELGPVAGRAVADGIAGRTSLVALDIS